MQCVFEEYVLWILNSVFVGMKGEKMKISLLDSLLSILKPSKLDNLITTENPIRISTPC